LKVNRCVNVTHENVREFPSGKGCKRCAVETTSDRSKLGYRGFVAKAKEVHGLVYTYLPFDYSSNKSIADIVCKKHGRFTQSVTSHLAGSGCPWCGRATIEASTRVSAYEFVAKATILHSGRYKYDTSTYSSLKLKMSIFCYVHGWFRQSGKVHLRGAGCRRCNAKTAGDNRRMTTGEFLVSTPDAKDYPYKLTGEYRGSNVHTEFTCKKHGKYLQTPDGFKTGVGCNSCRSMRVSSQENSLRDYLRSVVGPECKVEQGVRGLFLDTEHEIDLYLPSLKLGIEYNGVHWHSIKFKSRRYHLDKTLAAEKAGIRLIHIFSDMWSDPVKQEKTKRYLLAMLTEGCKSVGARKCEVVDVAPAEYKLFCETHHLMGPCTAGIKRGLRFGGALIAVAGFRAERQGTNLVRYAVGQDYKIPGGLARLCKGVPRPVMTFCDLSVFTGKSYEMAGFKQVGQTPPDLWYTKGSARENRRGFQKAKLAVKFGAENVELSDTEKSICQKNGWHQIYGVGLRKYLLS